MDRGRKKRAFSSLPTPHGIILWIFIFVCATYPNGIAATDETSVKVEVHWNNEQPWQLLGAADPIQIRRDMARMMSDKSYYNEVLEHLARGKSHSIKKRQTSSSNSSENRPPYFTSPKTIGVTVGEVSTAQVTAKDLDRDRVTIILESPSPSSSLTSDGLFTFITPPNENFVGILSEMLKVTFIATDSRGGRTLLQPEWQLCGCENGGLCNYDILAGISTGRIFFVGCECAPAYDGQLCTEDRNGCRGNPCYAGVTCVDKVAPEAGYSCGECPSGLIGDGITCLRELLRFDE